MLVSTTVRIGWPACSSGEPGLLCAIKALRSAEEDQDFFFRLALAGEVGFLDEVLTTVYEQPGSYTTRFFSREHETALLGNAIHMFNDVRIFPKFRKNGLYPDRHCVRGNGMGMALRAIVLP